MKIMLSLEYVIKTDSNKPIQKLREAVDGDDEEAAMNQVNVKIDNVYVERHTPLFKDVIDAINENRAPLV